MSLEEFFKELKIFLEANRCQVCDLSSDTRLEELEMNSVELTCALLEIEDHFQVLVPDETWNAWQMLGDIVNYIAEYKQAQEIIKLTKNKEKEGTD